MAMLKCMLLIIALLVGQTNFSNASPIKQDGPSKLYSDDIIAVFKEKEKACQKQLSVSESLQERINQGDYINLDNNEKCYILCFLKQSGIFTPKGKNLPFDSKTLKTSFSIPVLGQLNQQCSPGLRVDNECEAGYVFFVCYMRHKDYLNKFLQG